MTKTLKQYYIDFEFEDNTLVRTTLVVAYTPKEAREIFLELVKINKWKISFIGDAQGSKKKWSSKAYTKEEYYQKELAEIERFKKFHIH